LAVSIYVRSSIKFLHFVPFHQQIWPPRASPFGQAVSEEKIFLTLANQKKELILVAIFVGRMEPNEEAL
jgi:alkylhydroperoxidase/carboxymuconolactone decarboxylase family protein YurZ